MNLKKSFIARENSRPSGTARFGRTLAAAAFLAATSILLHGCGPRWLLRPQPQDILQPQPQDKITWAAMVGDLDLLKKLEAQGISLSYQDPRSYNWTLLMAAIHFQQTNVINYLLSRNVDLNIQDRNGETALIRAVIVGDTNTVWLLLQKGADATIADRYGITAYENARASGTTDPGARAVLLEWLGKRNR